MAHVIIKINYPYIEHLGSIMALTDGVGNVVHRQAFDSWGRRRDPNTWYTDDSKVPPAQYRWLWGYTGHEQLDDFGLVNMNARLYDLNSDSCSVRCHSGKRKGTGTNIL